MLDDLFQQSENEIINILGDDHGLMMKHCQGRLGTPCKPGFTVVLRAIRWYGCQLSYRCIREFVM